MPICRPPFLPMLWEYTSSEESTSSEEEEFEEEGRRLMFCAMACFRKTLIPTTNKRISPRHRRRCRRRSNSLNQLTNIQEGGGGGESVHLRVTHSNLKTFSADLRFSLHTTVEAVKEQLWRKCGTCVHSMSLQLFAGDANVDDDGSVNSPLDNSKPLGFYYPLDGYRLHVIDLDPSSATSGGGLVDTLITRETYEKCDGTYSKFEENLASQNPSTLEDKVGDRCEIEPGDKRAVVKFVGRAESLALGPLGRNHLKRSREAEPVQTHMIKAVNDFNENSRSFIQMRLKRDAAKREKEALKEARDRESAEIWKEFFIMSQDLSKMNEMQRKYWEKKQAGVLMKEMQANQLSEYTPSNN